MSAPTPLAEDAQTNSKKLRATIAVGMSNYLEAGSIIAIATTGAFWQDAFGISNLMIGILAAFSSNAFGAAIGAAIGGPLCDRYGRKFIYTYDLLMYMVGVLLAAAAMNTVMLFLGFLICGISVGASVTAAWTYIAEEAPDHQRAKHVGISQLAWSFGPLFGFALAALLNPLGLIGSRLLFAHLFVIAFIAWLIRRGLPESQRWNNRNSDSSRVGTMSGIRELFTHKKNIQAVLFLIGVYTVFNIVAAQAGIFQPRIYSSIGLTDVVAQDLVQVLLYAMACLSGYFGFILLGDRVSRRWLYGVGSALGVIGWVILIYAPPTFTTLIGFALCWGMSLGISAQPFYGLWSAELFTTRLRGSAQGLLFFVARVVPGILTFVFPVLLAQFGLKTVGVFLVGLLAVSTLIGMVWAPETRGKSLELIEAERFGTATSRPPGTDTEQCAVSAAQATDRSTPRVPTHTAN